MIRLVFLLRRKADRSLEEFQRYWRETHGPLVASFQRDLNILRYTQLHTLDSSANARMAEARGGMEPPYDGVAELWWESEESLAEVVDKDAGRRLLEDEQQFIDLPQSPLYLTHEYPQVNPIGDIVAKERSSIVKLHFPLRARGELSLEEAQLYWRTNHGPLIRSQAAAGGILRYMQVHRYESQLEPALRESRGTVVEPYLGHAEVWFDRGVARRGPEADAAGQRAIEDEAKFIDFKRSTMFVGKEHVFIDRM